jgi:H+/Cl- antiporter ClcA
VSFNDGSFYNRRMNRLPDLRLWRSRLVFWSGALAVGGAAVLFTELTDWAITRHALMTARWPWANFLVTPLGLACVTWMTQRWFSGAQGSGIPQAIAALNMSDESLRGRLLSLRVAVAKVGMTTLALLSGASVGREGPTVHVGASIMLALDRFTDVPHKIMQRNLILAGSAAGVAAAFNTPIAGIVFAIEEMARTFEEKTTGTLLTTVVIAGVVSTALLGNYVYFGRAAAHLPNPSDWYAVPICGMTGGLLGGAFSALLIRLSSRLVPLMKEHPFRTALLLGLLIACIGWLSQGATYGTGYAQARALLMDGHIPNVWFPFYKLAATLTSYLTGVPGGIFSPSLSTGAGLGADLAPLFPNVQPSAVIILGMVAYFTGVTQAPMTGAVIVMEMVDDHALILPILGTAFFAALASRLVCKQPIYLALSRGFLPPSPAPASGEKPTP